MTSERLGSETLLEDPRDYGWPGFMPQDAEVEDGGEEEVGEVEDDGSEEMDIDDESEKDDEEIEYDEDDWTAEYGEEL